MSDGPSDCARMEEKAKREAEEEGYIWDNLTLKEQSDWMFWNKRPEKKEKIIPPPIHCANCKFYNCNSQRCSCKDSGFYNYIVTYAAKKCCEYHSFLPSSKPSKRKLMLLGDD